MEQLAARQIQNFSQQTGDLQIICYFCYVLRPQNEGKKSIDWIVGRVPEIYEFRSKFLGDVESWQLIRSVAVCLRYAFRDPTRRRSRVCPR
jgi:hypothetical protein